MTDPLDELVAEGRSEREQANDTEKREQRSREREVDRAVSSKLWASASAYALWLWWAWPVLVTIALAVIAHVAAPKDDDDALSGLVVVGSIPLLLVAWKLRGTFGRRAVARNEAKLRALPFAVSGYAAALSSNSTEGTAQLVIHFAKGETKQRDDVGFRNAGAVHASELDEKTIADAFFTIGAELQKEPRKNGARVVEWEVSSGESSYSTNAHLDAFVWRAVEVLQAIHTRHPITSVEIHGFR